MSAKENVATHSIEVGQVLDSARFGSTSLLVAIFTTLTFVFDGFDIQAIAFAAPSLLADWNISRPSLAPVLAAGLLGMGLGGLTIGWLGDRVGRRRALILCMTIVAVSSLLCAYATSLYELAVLRLLVGIGLGGSMPNATALIAEFAPVRWRNYAVTITVVGVPIGGIIGAAIAAETIPAFGWPSIFFVGALLPAALAAAMVGWLPESARFLVGRQARWPDLARILNRVLGARRFNGTETFYLSEKYVPAGRSSISELLSPELRFDTLMIWLIFLTNIFAVYAIFNWLPTVLSAVGLPLQTAIHGSLVFNLGGVIGALVGAGLMTRYGSRVVLTSVAVGAVVTTFAIGPALMSAIGLPTQLAAMAFSGACISSLQVGMYSVGAYVYPTACRASGLGWALGVARFGGILSALAGGWLLTLGSPSLSFFSGIAGILLLTTLGIILLRKHIPAAAAKTAAKSA